MNMLFLAPHEDDVELACGATLARFIEEGHNIFWVVFTRTEAMSKEHMAAHQEFNLPDESYKMLDFEPRSLFNRRQEVLDQNFLIKDQFKPDLVIGPSLEDFHQDHRTVANEMVRAFKTSACIICYELPWNHISFAAQLLVKVENSHIEQKLRAVKQFKSQLSHLYFSEDFLRGLLLVRGVQANSKFAEAFEILRWQI